MTLLEMLFKAGITIAIVVLVYWQVAFLKWLWPTHIDVQATLSRFIRQAAPKTDLIATRDPNKIYQKGIAVGNIIGNVKEEDDTIVFEKLTDTSSLERNAPFEYKRSEYRIDKFDKASSVNISNITGVHEDVLKNVTCRKVK